MLVVEVWDVSENSRGGLRRDLSDTMKDFVDPGAKGLEGRVMGLDMRGRVYWRHVCQLGAEEVREQGL